MSTTVSDALGYAARNFLTTGGVRGLAAEVASLTSHLALYPWGVWREHLRTDGPLAHYRTDELGPAQRGLLVANVDAAGVGVLMVHGFLDNRSIFTNMARILRRRGFGAVHAVNYSVLTPLTGDIRTAAAQLDAHVDVLLRHSGCDRIHLVGHSLGGLIARYYVQRLGGDAKVDTVVTLGTPHHGTVVAHLLPPTTLVRQLRPGSDLLTELREPAPGCRTRFVVVWSRTDSMVLPQGNAQLRHDDLHVEAIELSNVGHLSLPVNSRVGHAVANALAGTGQLHRSARRYAGMRYAGVLAERESPAS